MAGNSSKDAVARAVVKSGGGSVCSAAANICLSSGTVPLSLLWCVFQEISLLPSREVPFGIPFMKLCSTPLSALNRRISRSRLGALAASALVTCALYSAQAAAAFPTDAVTAFTDQFCSSCHNDVDKEGGLDLTSLGYVPTDAANFATWVKVYDRLQNGEMPPKEKKQPATAELGIFLKTVSTTLVTTEEASTASFGRATRRRLNRSEYENVLRDILSAPWIEVKDQLPEDGESSRFNKVADALDVSHVHMARYMSAADYALRQAMAVKLVQPPTVLKRYYARESMPYASGDGNPDRGRFPIVNSQPDPDVLMRTAPITVGDADPAKREQEAMAWTASSYVTGFNSNWITGFRAPVAGRYRMRFSGYTVWVGPNGVRVPTISFIGGTNKDGDAQAIANLPAEWHRPNFWDVSRGRRSEPISVYAKGGPVNRLLGGFEITPDPTTNELGEIWLAANEYLMTDATRFFRSRPTGIPDGYTNPLARRDGMPGVAFRWMEIEGPLFDENTTSGYQLLFGDLPMKPVGAGATNGVAIDTVASEPAAAGGRGARGARGARGGAAATTEQPVPEGSSVHFRAAVKARSMGLGRGGGAGGPGIANVSAVRQAVVEVESTNPMSDADRLLRSFLKRVYRTPVEEVDVKLFLDLIKTRLDSGAGFASSMLSGYTAVLASPGFLFVDDKPGQLEDPALATRLALFLWNSEPDAALRAKAARGELGRPEVLRAEVDRMLADPRSQRFVNAFLDYWLEVRRIEDTTPSTTLYNDYYLDDSLVEASLAETRLFFTELVARNLPARNVIDSDFTFVNGRLATLYGLPGITGYAMRRVDLPKGSVRGGVMTQASVLKVTANGTTTSPVLRGKWIMERIIGYEIPPPPAAVPAVEPDIRGAVTIRQQLDKHRADESCAMCHRKIDPPGFALEGFDVMGGARDRYRAESKLATPELGVGKNGWPFAFHYAQPVDPSGELADGRAFKDVRDFKKLLLADEAQIARNLTRQMSVFATGARVRFSDRAKIDQIVQSAAASQYGVKNLIHELVQSDLFRSK